MGFASNGVYTPASGATTAAPGGLIQSSVWNAVFADITSALSSVGGSLLAEPTTVTASTVTSGPASIIFNASGTCTITLSSAASFPGSRYLLRTIAAQTVVSASSNVIPLVGGAAGTAILAATAGKWAILQSDGTNWQIMAAN